jgi:NitT/TauT family transport system substrate-binding protein
MTRSLTAAAVAAVLAVAGCGSDDEQAASSGGGESGGGTEKVVVALPGDYVGSAPFYVAQKQDLFSKHGLEVEVVKTMGGPASDAAVASGSAQFNITALSELFQANLQGQSLRVLSPLTVQSQLSCIVRKDLEGEFPGADAPWEEKAKALKGRAVGVPSVGGGIGNQVEYIYKSATGEDAEGNVKQVALGVDPPALAGALKNNRVDVLCHAVPVTELAESQVESAPYISPGDIEPIAGMVDLAMFTSQKVTEERPEIVTKMRDTIQEAMTYLEENPEEGQEEARTQAFSAFPAEAFNAGYDKLEEGDGLSYSTEFTQEGFDKAKEYAAFVIGKPIDLTLEDIYAAPAS